MFLLQALFPPFTKKHYPRRANLEMRNLHIINVIFWMKIKQPALYETPETAPSCVLNSAGVNFCLVLQFIREKARKARLETAEVQITREKVRTLVEKSV